MRPDDNWNRISSLTGFTIAQLRAVNGGSLRALQVGKTINIPSRTLPSALRTAGTPTAVAQSGKVGTGLIYKPSKPAAGSIVYRRAVSVVENYYVRNPGLKRYGTVSVGMKPGGQVAVFVSKSVRKDLLARLKSLKIPIYQIYGQTASASHSEIAMEQWARQSAGPGGSIHGSIPNGYVSNRPCTNCSLRVSELSGGTYQPGARIWGAMNGLGVATMVLGLGMNIVQGDQLMRQGYTFNPITGGWVPPPGPE